MVVRHTRLGRQDLKDIGDYLAHESSSPGVALRFVDRIAAKCTIYAAQPALGELCPDLGMHVRRFPVGNYVVFYQPLEKGIEVLRVLHASRDIPAVWRRGQSG